MRYTHARAHKSNQSRHYQPITSCNFSVFTPYCHHTYDIHTTLWYTFFERDAQAATNNIFCNIYTTSNTRTTALLHAVFSAIVVVAANRERGGTTPKLYTKVRVIYTRRRYLLFLLRRARAVFFVGLYLLTARSHYFFTRDRSW